MSARRKTGRLGERWLRANGQEIRYRVSLGPQPAAAVPVVLVPGVASGTYLVPLAEYLAPHYRVYVPDLPGVGASPAPNRALDLDFLAEALLGWMDACDLGEAHLVGQSFGCNIAVEAALRRPAAARTLALQGLSLPPSRRRPGLLALRWVINALREVRKPPEMRQGLNEVSLGNRLSMFRAMLAHRVEERLPLLECPALVVQGGHDLIVPAEWARRPPCCRVAA